VEDSIHDVSSVGYWLSAICYLLSAMGWLLVNDDEKGEPLDGRKDGKGDADGWRESPGT
jgi:hypothetical protein